MAYILRFSFFTKLLVTTRYVTFFYSLISYFFYKVPSSAAKVLNARILFTSIIVCDFKRSSDTFKTAFRILLRTPEESSLHIVLWEESEEEDVDDEATISRYPPLDLT